MAPRAEVWQALFLGDLDVRRGRQRRSVREALRMAIQDGRLAAATRLPSSRQLADGLGVSRGVVTDAYDQLALEGYLDIRPRSAPVVVPVPQVEPCEPDPVVPSWPYDFVATTPDISLFPRPAWRRAVERVLRDAPDAAFDYGEYRGRIELRTALAAYLGRVRGVRVDPARIVITQGFTQGLHLLCRAVAIGGGDTIAVESPSLTHLWATVEAAGMRTVGCPMDGSGPVLAALRGLEADALIVSPAHQFPTGTVMAPARRTALVDWARERDTVIIEDDYDAEFRYDRQPIGALQGLDPERVVHAGTTSKTLAPGIRLGWLSLPAGLIEVVTAQKNLADSGSPTIDQLAFAQLLESGDYERHVARARQLYRRRRDLLMSSLRTHLPRYRLDGAAAGMHVLLRLDPGVDDAAIADAAAARGVGVRPLSPFHLLPSDDRGLLLGYGRLAEHRIDEAVRELAAVLR